MNQVKLSLVVIVLLNAIGWAQGQGYKEEQLTFNAYDDSYASYNKVGETIIFESNRDGHWQIYSMDVDGNNQRRVIRSEYNDRRPTWNPYQNMILFESDRSGVNHLYTYDLDTNTLQKVPISLKGNKSFAQFAPNGKELIFSYKISDNNFNIYMVALNGKRLKTIVNNAYANMYPRFSPTGDAVLYFSRKQTKGENDEIYVRNMYNKDETRLTRWPKDDHYASYSNSGSRIAYVSATEDSNPQIFLMTKDGKSPRRITFNTHNDAFPNWSPQDFNLLITRKINGHDQICKILLKEEL